MKKLPTPTPNELKLIISLARKLAPRYTFSYFTNEDLIQEAVLIGLEGLQHYDSDRGALTTFLYAHINNALINFKKNKQGDPRVKVLETRINVMEPLSLEEIDDRDEKNTFFYCDPLSKIEMEELFLIIEQHLPANLRLDYLMVRDGVYIPHNRKERLMEVVKEIVDVYYGEL